MSLTDEQLMLLEQLTYMDTDVANEASVSLNTNAKTVQEFIQPFLDNPDALKKLENSTRDSISGGVMQGSEWAAIIREVENDPELMQLEMDVNYTSQKDKTIDNIVFTEPNGDPNKAIVAFRGTLDGTEWNDNFLGFNTTDTECQQEALRFINGLPYNDITVIGHSKGGNKAQYCTLLSDKVTYCLSMDGQGFSPEFIDKYWAEIQARGYMINNYSLKNDFVHGIILTIPGSNQKYFTGSGMANAAENHSPCSFFQFMQDDKTGFSAIIHNEDGSIYLIEVDEEDLSLQYIHKFFNFVENIMPDDQKNQVVTLLGPLLAMTIGGGIVIDGTLYKGQDDALKYLSEHQEEASVLLGYLLKYIYLYDLSDEEICSMFESFGFGDIADGIKEFQEEHPWLFSMGVGSIKSLLKQLGDGKDDKIIKWLLGYLSDYLKEKGIDIDIEKLWDDTERVFSSIDVTDLDAAIAEPTLREDKIYNFSKEAFENIMETISSFENYLYEIVDWSKYENEKWSGDFLISSITNAINSYIDGVAEQMSTSKARIEETFNKIWVLDNEYSTKIEILAEDVTSSKDKYTALAECIK